MVTIVKQKSGRWRVQVRRKGRYLSETFSLRKDAEAWARRVERDLDVGRKPIPRKLEGDRKDPRNKRGNHQNIPLLDVSGYDAFELIEEQARHLGHRKGRIFPYNTRSAGTAFRRACRDLRIEDLHFHDLRHDATSRLFGAEYEIPELSLVAGHKDWKMLQRYTHIRPQGLHVIGARRRAARQWARLQARRAGGERRSPRT